jgi:UDP-N-acetylglucosamine 4-epimerase
MYELPFHTSDLSKQSFLVTGGAGFIGANIVEYLLKHKAGHVRVLDNLATGSMDNIREFEENPAFEFIRGDIRDADLCAEACEGIQFVCHQAALGSVPRSLRDPITTHQVNASGFLHVVEAARQAKVKRVVYASSSSVYGDEKDLPKTEEKIGHAISPYAVSKLSNEQYARVYARLFGMDIIGLRYFNVFGPKQDPSGPYAAVVPIFINSLLTGIPVFIDGDGSQTRDFTFVENAVQANIKALTLEGSSASGDIFNVAVGKNYSVLELYNIIAKVLGKKVKPQFREARDGDIHDSLADISKARKTLGYEPNVGLEEGIKRALEFFMSKAPVKP